MRDSGSTMSLKPFHEYLAQQTKTIKNSVACGKSLVIKYCIHQGHKDTLHALEKKKVLR